MLPKDPYLRALAIARQLAASHTCQEKMESISKGHRPDFVFLPANPGSGRKLYLHSDVMFVRTGEATTKEFLNLENVLESFGTFSSITVARGESKQYQGQPVREEAQWIIPIHWEGLSEAEMSFSDGKISALGLLVLTPGAKFQWIGVTTASFMDCLRRYLSARGFQQIDEKNSDYLRLSPDVELSSLLRMDNLGSAEAADNFQAFLTYSEGYISELAEPGESLELALSQQFWPLQFSDRPIAVEPGSPESPNLFHEGLVIVRSIGLPATLSDLLQMSSECLLGKFEPGFTPPLPEGMQGLLDGLKNSRADLKQFCRASFLWVLQALLNNATPSERVPESTREGSVSRFGARRSLDDELETATEAQPSLCFDEFFKAYNGKFRALISQCGDFSTFAAFVSRVVLEMIRQHIDPAILERISVEFLKLVDRISLLERRKLQFLSFYWNISDLLKNRDISLEERLKRLKGIKDFLETVFQRSFLEVSLSSEAVQNFLDGIVLDCCFGLEPVSGDSEPQPRDLMLFSLTNLINADCVCIAGMDFIEGCLSRVPETLKTHPHCHFGEGEPADQNALDDRSGSSHTRPEQPSFMTKSLRGSVHRPKRRAGDAAVAESLQAAGLPPRWQAPPPPPGQPATVAPAVAAGSEPAGPREKTSRTRSVPPPVKKSSFWRGFGRVILGGLGLTLIGIGVLAVLAFTHGAAVAPIATAMPWLVNTVIHPVIAAMGVTGSVTVVSTVSFALGVPSLIEAVSPKFFERCCGCFRPGAESGSLASGEDSTRAVHGAVSAAGSPASELPVAPPGGVSYGNPAAQTKPVSVAQQGVNLEGGACAPAGANDGSSVQPSTSRCSIS